MTGRGVQTTRVRSFHYLMPHFHDLPDGSSSINHTGEDFWVGIDHIDEMSFTAGPIPPPPVNFEITENPFIPPPDPTRRTATEIMLAEQAYRTAPIDLSPQVCDPSLPRRPRRRRGFSDPDAAIRKDPNAWSLREAVELCKLLEVVLPEAGFHIALTGPLLHKEGKQKDCDLLFYQVRGAEPNYETLWKYLTVAGVIRSPSYPENGWLVKATYRGKAIDCLFPNAKKAKKAGAAILVRHNDGVPEFSAPYTAADLLATPAPAPVSAVEQWEEPF